jgi:hypothetical protein
MSLPKTAAWSIGFADKSELLLRRTTPNHPELARRKELKRICHTAKAVPACNERSVHFFIPLGARRAM